MLEVKQGEVCGKPISMLTLRMPASFYRAVKTAAHRDELSMNSWAINVLRRAIAESTLESKSD